MDDEGVKKEGEVREKGQSKVRSGRGKKKRTACFIMKISP
jgi:hypothetical protein